MRDTTRDVHAQLKALRLNGMAVAWADLVEQGGDSTLDGLPPVSRTHPMT